LDPILYWNYFAFQLNLVSHTNGKKEQTGAGAQLTGPRWVMNKSKPDLAQNLGGVPLGLKIAEDIFQNGLSKSTVSPAE